MTPEAEARQKIDEMLRNSGWIVQSMKELNISAGRGVAVCEFPTDTGPVDYALFVDNVPVGVIEAKADTAGEHLADVEIQSGRYATSRFKWIKRDYKIRFVYETTSIRTYFTDYADEKYCSREVFSFHRPETLAEFLRDPSTIRNRMKSYPPLDEAGFRGCQITAINNLEKSFAEARPRALIQMATGAGKTYAAITAIYRLLKFAKVRRVLFLVDTRGLGEQAEGNFVAYQPNDAQQKFSELYGVCRLRRSFIPPGVQVCISTIQRMYSILKGEELDESAEEESVGMLCPEDRQKVREVVYNPQYPPEFFDVIFIDECHRSIYHIWKQVLEYFDAFLVGMTATPEKRTLAFFNQNLVSEYSREQAIVDGVNVGEDVFVIETEVGKNGGTILKQQIERRNRLTREKRWEQLDEDLEYQSTELDHDIVNPSQIRTVIRAFREALFTKLFPRRREVPKTLIFAKTDSHAEDIIRIVREEFGEGNEFCRKITYRATEVAPKTALGDFCNDYNPRIAVTVDMIATGTDVQAIEILIFMRDVRSKSYFEQMKGRGTRTMKKDDLQKVTPSAVDAKDHFVIVDAVGVTKSRKSDTRPLERKPAVSVKELMMNVALGARDDDTLTSLANRLVRLNSQMNDGEKAKFAETAGLPPGKLAENLLNAFDEDCLTAKAQVKFGTKSPSPEQIAEVQKAEVDAAVSPIQNPAVRDYIENVRRSHEQIIDNVNIDRVLAADFDKDQEAHAERTLQTFREFIEENKDELTALQIIYSQPYRDRPMAIGQLKALYEKLKARSVTVERLWDCYGIIRPARVKRGTVAQLTDLVSMIRFESGQTDHLEPFSDRVNYNFMQWTLRRNAGAVHFTDEQMEWLRLIKDHIAASLSIVRDDLDLSPFDRKGGLGGFYAAFGARYEDLLNELNRELVS